MLPKRFVRLIMIRFHYIKKHLHFQWHIRTICKIRKCFFAIYIDSATQKMYNEGTMKFSNIKVKTLNNISKHTPTMKQWKAGNRPTHIIGIQLCGDMYHEIGGTSISLGKNYLFFFNQKDDFCAYVKELGESYTIHFTTYEPIETESFALLTKNATEAISILDKIEHALRTRDTDENLAMSEFYRFCHLLESLREQSYSQTDRRISDAKKHFDLNFREINIQSVADRTGLTRRRFNELFKKQYGVTPGHYLTSVKVQEAKSLLLDNDLSVQSIAALCGFESHYYFCKVFKKQTGVTPTQFRKGLGA